MYVTSHACKVWCTHHLSCQKPCPGDKVLRRHCVTHSRDEQTLERYRLQCLCVSRLCPTPQKESDKRHEQFWRPCFAKSFLYACRDAVVIYTNAQRLSDFEQVLR